MSFEKYVKVMKGFYYDHPQSVMADMTGEEAIQRISEDEYSATDVISLVSFVHRLKDENRKVKEALREADGALEGTLQLLMEHPVLKGHAERVGKIHKAMYIVRKAMEKK
jgi:hypothetical protein